MEDGKMIEDRGLGFNPGFRGPDGKVVGGKTETGTKVIGAVPGVNKLTPPEIKKGLEEIHKEAVEKGILSPQTPDAKAQNDEFDPIKYVLHEGTKGASSQESRPSADRPSSFEDVAKLIQHEGSKGQQSGDKGEAK